MSTLRKIAEFQVSTLMTTTRVYRDAAHSEYVVKIVSAGQTKARPEENYFTSDKGDAMRTAQSIAGWPSDADIAKHVDAWLNTEGLTDAMRMQVAIVANELEREAIKNDPLYLSADAKTYAVELQGFAALNAHSARVHAGCAMAIINGERNGPCAEYDIEDYRARAVQDQETARMRFQTIAGVRGLFDTPCMDDAHAVECEPSRIGPRVLPVGFPVCFMTEEEIQANAHAMAQARFNSARPMYRERAINCYGRYAMYCARAVVAPLPFAEWFADCYSGNEYSPSANWN